MRLAKSITLERTWLCLLKGVSPVLLLFVSIVAKAQDNSPYSRYGLGNLSPYTNISTRGMGSVSAAYSDPLSINFNNPATYSNFQTFIEQRSKKVSQGRVVLDVGMNFDNRSLIIPNTSSKYGSTDAFFSYVQVGLPIRKNWGMSFGIRPLSRISYSISQNEMLHDPNTGNVIDSANTQYTGSGGSYLPTIGTGFAFDLSQNNHVSFGFNIGYLFGKRETVTNRAIIDSIVYHPSNYSTTTSFGNVFLSGGMQYEIDLNKQKTKLIRLGLDGNLEQKLNASQDILRQTFTVGTAGDIITIDSVYTKNGVEGKIIYPSSYTAGFLIQNLQTNGSGWILSADYTQSKWSHYRIYDQMDSVQDNWRLNVGAEFIPKAGVNYFSRVIYRFGFNTGPDYIKVQNSLPQFGVSFGMGLPIASHTRLTNQFTVLNLALEYGKRGNNSNLIKENLFRLSIGFNFTDFWFGKRKYD
ncbi:MAG: hypothetical protein ACJ748_04610 [Flavisolibacter sp.]